MHIFQPVVNMMQILKTSKYERTPEILIHKKYVFYTVLSTAFIFVMFFSYVMYISTFLFYIDNDILQIITFEHLTRLDIRRHADKLRGENVRLYLREIRNITLFLAFVAQVFDCIKCYNCWDIFFNYNIT